MCIRDSGGASVKGIIDFLKSRLDAPVEIANPFNYVQSKLEISDLTQLSDKGLRFAAAVGLAQGD